MKRPATNGARRKAGARGSSTARVSGGASPKGEIKVTRNSARPQIKASRGPGGPVKQRKVAPSKRGRVVPRGVSEIDRRVAETRRQSISSHASAAKPKSARSSAPRAGGSRQGSARPVGGGSVRAVAVGAGAGAAAGAARVVQEVARPVGAVTKPVLRVVSGGLEAIPQAASKATPATRGRLLILFVGALAAGLIYINVARLEAGDSYAKYSARSLELQRQNTILRSQIANRGAAERIRHYAEGQGLVMPAPEQFDYLRHRRGDAERAARNLTAPTSQARPIAPGATGAAGAAPAGPSVATGGAL